MLDAIARFEIAQIRDIGPDTDWSFALRNVDAVLHLAGRVHVMRAKSQTVDEFHRINTQGTLALARQAAAQGVRRLVFVSSIKVNGQSTTGQPFHHDDVPVPSDDYARSKLEAERGLQRIEGIETVIVRPPMVYGPGVRGNLARLCRLVQLGIPLPFGAIHNRRDLVSLDNLLDLVTSCLEHPAAAGQTFLVSDGSALSTPQLCKEIAKAMDRRARIVSVTVSLLRFVGRLLGRAAEIERLTESLEIDLSHTQNVLGWKPEHGIQEGLLQMVGAYLGQRS